MQSSEHSATAAWQVEPQDDHPNDPLVEALVLLSQHHGNPCSEDSLTEGLPLVDNRLTPDLVPRSAERAGLAARLASQPLSSVSTLLLPALLLLNDRSCCVLLELDRDQGRARILQPEAGGGETWLDLDALEGLYAGHLFYVKKKYRFDERSPEVIDTRRHHWFWSTLRENRLLYLDVVVASVLINLFAVASPLFVMNVYDRVIPNLAFESLWVLATGILIVFTFDFIMRQLRAHFIDLVGKKLDLKLSARIFSRVMGIRMEARPPSVGAFANQLQSFESVREFITSATLSSLIDLPFALLLVLVIWIVAGPLALVPLVAMLVMVAYSFYVQRPLARAIVESGQYAAQKNATLVEGLSGLESLRIAGAQSQFQEQWERNVSEMGRLEMASRRLSTSVASLSSYLQQLVTVATVVLGVYQVAEGALSMGGIIAAVMLGSRAITPMAQLSLLATRYNQAKAAMGLIDQVMKMPEEQSLERKYVNRPELFGDIEFDQVDFRYPHQEGSALRGVSFRIRAGEKVGIIGRIGAGKSSINRLLLGLYQPSAGAIRIDGINLAQIHPADLRRNIGSVTQENQLFFGSIRDNILLGAPYSSDERLVKAADFGGVSDFTNTDPEGLERQVGEGGRFLSGGQRQAVAMARAALLRPPIFLLDEPSSQLDNRAERALLERLKSLGPNRTLLLTTHKTSMLEAVDRLLVIDQGRLVADGPKEKVLALLAEGRVRGARQGGEPTL
ncbi:type I secretion system permease/ATPase [Motiliproteus sp. SC1-56]|uniref:type I secretion system permease/ATPase n=1 Tax=Motiliproteus sp. SC1-56 TaxID=2799565 RepID=UPI001A8DC703|nr:type I secretion system permease/ATPase [Motiliproteus sp. SC1-56]